MRREYRLRRRLPAFPYRQPQCPHRTTEGLPLLYALCCDSAAAPRLSRTGYRRNRSPPSCADVLYLGYAPSSSRALREWSRPWVFRAGPLRSWDLFAFATIGLLDTLGDGAQYATYPARNSEVLYMGRGSESPTVTTGVGNILNNVVRLKSMCIVAEIIPLLLRALGDSCAPTRLLSLMMRKRYTSTIIHLDFNRTT